MVTFSGRAIPVDPLEMPEPPLTEELEEAVRRIVREEMQDRIARSVSEMMQACASRIIEEAVRAVLSQQRRRL